MFNLVMRHFDWSGRTTLPHGRLFEYTEDYLADQFRIDGRANLEAMARLPCLFMNEGIEDQVARTGQISRMRRYGNEISIEYTIDADVPALSNSMIYAGREELNMPDFEFSRNHWAIKDVDLYRFLLRKVRPRRQRPIVFQVTEHESIESTLASAMMPFDGSFSAVYETIRQACTVFGLRCRRADDIWENASIIQDVVGLIDRSRMVICDCSGRNPNVFYEIGIAHTLGREVILITQSEHDIPFDLRHLRHIRYLNNAEGLDQLNSLLQGRMRTILGQ